MRGIASALVVAFGASAVPVAFAADPPPAEVVEAKELLAEITAAREKADERRLVVAFGKVGALYRKVVDPPLLESMRREIGVALKNDKLREVRRAALAALLETGATEHAWRLLSPVFPDPTMLLAEPWDLSLVDAAGTLHPDGAIPSLLALYDKASDAKLAAAAVTALGNFKSSKKRVSVLTGILTTAKRTRPVWGRRGPSDDGVTGRWALTGPATAAALDKLTGRSVGDPLQWLKLFDETKDPKTLFRD